MPHPNETRLKVLYDLFAEGDLDGFLAGCTEDVVFTVPGTAVVSDVYDRVRFPELAAQVVQISQGSFREEILAMVANDERGMLLLLHSLTRDGIRYAYRTVHVIEFQEGRISAWREEPGNLAEFEEAWGRRRPVAVPG